MSIGTFEDSCTERTMTSQKEVTRNFRAVTLPLEMARDRGLPMLSSAELTGTTPLTDTELLWHLLRKNVPKGSSETLPGLVVDRGFARLHALNRMLWPNS